MKAVAVRPGKPDSVHLVDVDKPQVKDIPLIPRRQPDGVFATPLEPRPGYGVLVKVLKVGVDATDREINEGLYGDAPPGDDFLILGHECFGVVEEVGESVTSVKPGDFVTATVRRPGTSIYDDVGTNDMTSDPTYYERGINLLHGFLTEYFVDDEQYIVRVPEGLKHLHVLMEPMSCAAKAIQQAYEIQRRLKVWKPRRAFVMGAGQIGLLGTLVLRLRGLEVYTIARRRPEGLRNAEIASGYGATYVSTDERSVDDLIQNIGGKPDIIFEATGNSSIGFKAMEWLNLNGVMIWHSVTGGKGTVEVPSDRINIEWVLGNKVLCGSVNANRGHFEEGIRDLALGESMYPGVTERLLTNPVEGLKNYSTMMKLLVEDRTALKVFVNVAE